MTSFISNGSVETAVRPSAVLERRLGAMIARSGVLDRIMPTSFTGQNFLPNPIPLFIEPALSGVPEIRCFQKEIEYEGMVISVNPAESTFTARLVNLAKNAPEEVGDFSLDELNGDEDLVAPGALFTFAIGLQMRGTSKQRVSEIRFRRLPFYTSDAIARAEAEAHVLSEFFNEQSVAESLTIQAKRA